jgi:hypothetical protein
MSLGFGLHKFELVTDMEMDPSTGQSRITRSGMVCTRCGAQMNEAPTICPGERPKKESNAPEAKTDSARVN